MNIQLEIFGDDYQHHQPQKNKKHRDVDKEAKLLLEKAGINHLSKEVKALICAKLMAEYFPEMHRTLLMTLATTAIKS